MSRRVEYTFEFEIDMASALSPTAEINRILADFGIAERVAVEAPLVGKLTVARELTDEEMSAFRDVIEKQILQGMAQYSPRMLAFFKSGVVEAPASEVAASV